VPSRQQYRVAAVATVFVVAGLAGCGGDKATLRTFEGGWIGHGRTFTVTRTGDGREWLTLGLGHLVMDLRFKLSEPKGTPDDATATATVTAVRLGKEKVFTAKHPAPRVGESRTIRLRDDVITGLAGDHYCGNTIRDSVAAGCGV
jgi:serine/threonine protein phosphatase PrpC